MKGIIPKRIVSKSLSCHTCTFFRDDDEDIYYCELDKIEFPQQCKEYCSKEEVHSNHSETA